MYWLSDRTFAGNKMGIRSVTLLLCFLAFILYEVADGRISYRSSSRSGYSSKLGFGGIGKYKKATSSGYHVYGMDHYQNRFYGTRYYKKNPIVCIKLRNNMTYKEGERSMQLEMFVCPYEEADSDKARFCCGKELEEYCCTFWQSKMTVEGVFEIVGWIILILAVLMLLACCIIQNLRHRG